MAKDYQIYALILVFSQREKLVTIGVGLWKGVVTEFE